MTKLIAIDGDILVYMIALANERNYYVCNGNLYKTKGKAEIESKKTGKEISPYKYYLPEPQLSLTLNAKIKSIYDDLGTENYKMFITATDRTINFRNQWATIWPYKGNRTTKKKPLYYEQVRKLLINQYDAELIEGEEADDAIGKLATNMYNNHGNYEQICIASIDKDLRTIPGYHYHLKDRTLIYVNEDEASYNFHIQLVQGDKADNIPGLYQLLMLDQRIDEAKGLIKSKYLQKIKQNLLAIDSKDYYDEVIKLYNKYGYGDKEIAEIGRLLWIRRYDNEDWWEGKLNEQSKTTEL